jgi:hypothetical protein
VQSSGSPALDQETLGMLARALADAETSRENARPSRFLHRFRALQLQVMRLSGPGVFASGAPRILCSGLRRQDSPSWKRES